MAQTKMMLGEFPWDERYRVSDIEEVLTPALAIYPDIILSNIECTLRLMQGDANRWRAHIKTSKLGYTMRMLIDRGIRNFKCATTLELLEACRNGAADVLLAYPVMGANAARVREIAKEFPKVRVSVLAENEEQVQQWQGSQISMFLDLNPGMNRTGIELDQPAKIVGLIREIGRAGLEFRGLHYYDGQFGGLEEPQRTAAAHAGYDLLLGLVEEIQRSGLAVAEVVTSGTPTLPCSLSYPAFKDARFVHRVSPGTIVYCDATSLAQLPAEYGYAPAVLVVARVVSHPHADIVTCDAGHKAVSADAGVPTCVVVGRSGLEPLSPSEEHLPIRATETIPRVGEILFLIPRHICPTVNNFDCGLVVRDGHIEATEMVSARGHEAPLLQSLGSAIAERA